ncbi:MAG: sodium-translocating pyrophosphatase [Candidatus Woesearchaeota archaeon]
METVLLSVAIICFLTLLFTFYLYKDIMRRPAGTKKMQEISEAIRDGAIAFLKREYEILAGFIFVIVLVIIFMLNDPVTPIHEGVAIAISFVVGATLSVLAGVIGMRIATRANVRTTQAARKGVHEALSVAFSSGSVMGLSVVALGGLGLVLIISLFTYVFGFRMETVVATIAGFGFGASAIALFARVGGGIYTKAADVGADLVGKVEKNIPEDDPRNPAVIADNVGDNVGDVAGMGADLFESYVSSIIAAMTIGLIIYGTQGVLLPIVIAASGTVASVIAGILIRLDKKDDDVEHALKKGLIVSTLLVVVFTFFITRAFFVDYTGMFLATIAGLLAGLGIGFATEYYTSAHYGPTKRLSESAQTGAGPAIIQGLSLGYMSTFIPVVLISTAIIVSYHFAGLYGIALAAVGLLATLGYSLAIDAYGPVADNAGGIAEMSKLPKKVRDITDTLDSAGNTTAAMGKGFAIGSAALTTLALFSAYITAAGITSIDITKPVVIVGLLLGGVLPFVFSALTMSAVGRAASAIVNEVRHQFKKIKGIMTGKGKPDYTKCVDIATKASLKEMVLPGFIAISAPIIVGMTLGSEALGGLLAGALVTGILFAISMANSGGAWDNAKKYIEQGNFGGKGSDAHKAAVVGDTVGDPLKDTSGPSLNILIKLMSIVSLVFIVLFV